MLKCKLRFQWLLVHLLVHSWQESRKEQVVAAEVLGTFVFDE